MGIVSGSLVNDVHGFAQSMIICVVLFNFYGCGVVFIIKGGTSGSL